MLRRRRRVKPSATPVHEYVATRYEDTAVTIFMDIRRGRGLYSRYVPWVQAMLMQFIPAEEREKYWPEQVPLYEMSTAVTNRAWEEHSTGVPISGTALSTRGAGEVASLQRTRAASINRTVQQHLNAEQQVAVSTVSQQPRTQSFPDQQLLPFRSPQTRPATEPFQPIPPPHFIVPQATDTNKQEPFRPPQITAARGPQPRQATASPPTPRSTSSTICIIL